LVKKFGDGRALHRIPALLEPHLHQTNWTFGGKSGKSRLTITGLTPGKQYWFRVTAFLRDGTTRQHVTSEPFIVR
jgi:hypothetical protein